jgi:hypothetical protein
MLAWRQVGEPLKMFRPKRFGNGMFPAKPFSEVN